MRKAVLCAFGLVVAVLVALGLVVLSSASEANGIRIYNDAYHFIKRQFVFLGAGSLLCVAVARFDYRNWRDIPSLTWLFFISVFILLLAVFPPIGREINGSYRWLPLGPVNLQPSEFAKLAIVIALAVWLDRASWKVELFQHGFVYPSVFITALALPILLEPDFGSTMVIGLSGVVVMLLAGVRLLHLAPIIAVGLGLFVYKVATNANRMARIIAFTGVKINVGAEVSDAATDRAAYQANQALVAIKNSDIWGVGLTQSMQKNLYLPENHTDFVFAIGAEELGIVFSVGVMVLYLAFFFLAVTIARTAADRFGRILCFGMAFVVFFQAMFNIGVVCEAFPTKGMALPFFSYGGTNLITSFFAVGTILSVGIHSRREKKRERLRRILAS